MAHFDPIFGGGLAGVGDATPAYTNEDYRKAYDAGVNARQPFVVGPNSPYKCPPEKKFEEFKVGDQKWCVPTEQRSTWAKPSQPTSTSTYVALGIGAAVLLAIGWTYAARR